jgi:glycosyltransferase involved in cell wall biosynthesis
VSAQPRAAEAGPLVTIVIPARNEEANIPRLEAELRQVTDPLPYRFEFIVVDNASSDRTPELVKDICARDGRWSYLRFSRDFTVESSISAGYHHARGDAIIVLYSDLQDPPELISKFLEKWSEGYDVVYGTRTRRPGDPKWRNALVKVAYRVIAWSSDVKIPTDAGDFWLISRRVRDALDRCPEYNRYMRGMISWLGFRQVGVPYERRPRLAGDSKAPFLHLVTFVFNAISSYSLKPLRLFTLFGFLVLAGSLSAAAIYAVLSAMGDPPPGVTTLIVLAWMAIGLNALGIGILGEYVGRTYSEVKRRPLWVVEDAVNLAAVEGVLPPAEEDRGSRRTAG